MFFWHKKTPASSLSGYDQARKSTRSFQKIELDVEHDPHARAALEAYADSSAAEMPWLAETLDDTLRRTRTDLTYCSATVYRVLNLVQLWAATQPDYASQAWEHVRLQLDRVLGRQDASPHGDAMAPTLTKTDSSTDIK